MTAGSPAEDLAERLGRIPADPVPAGGAPPEPLDPSELSVTSQNGEDGVIAEILRRIGHGPDRFFVEFGIEDGRQGNCVALATVAGWDGLFIEVDPAMHAALAARMAPHPNVRTLQARITPGNVEAVFAAAGVPGEAAVLSIDVDGVDLWIWRAVRRVRARLVVIEYNAALDPDAEVTVPVDHHAPWDGTDYFGASLAALEHVAGEKGYHLVHTDRAGVNAFFVRADLAEGRFALRSAVPRRAPSYPGAEERGGRHPEDPLGRPYLDLRTGRLGPPPRRSPVDDGDAPSPPPAPTVAPAPAPAASTPSLAAPATAASRRRVTMLAALAAAAVTLLAAAAVWRHRSRG